MLMLFGLRVLNGWPHNSQTIAKESSYLQNSRKFVHGILGTGLRLAFVI